MEIGSSYISPASYGSSAAQQLTSGSRINTAADNAAGLAVATGMTTQINQQNVGVRNANDGIGLVQTASGAVSGITESIQRMRELSLQSMNGTLNDNQRKMLNTEFQQLSQGIQQVAETTKFNGQPLLDGSQGSVDIALGESNSSITLPDVTTANLGLDGLDINSFANANGAASQLDNVLKSLSDTQAQFGASQNGLEKSISNMMKYDENITASRSQIMDTDYARASQQKAQDDILNQVMVSMLSQKNQDKAQVLKLLN